MTNIAKPSKAVKAKLGLSAPAQTLHPYNSSNLTSFQSLPAASSSGFDDWFESAGCQYRLVIDALTLTAHRPQASQKEIIQKVHRIFEHESPFDCGIRRAKLQPHHCKSYRTSVELLQPNPPDQVKVHGEWCSRDGALTALVQLDPRTDGYAFVRLEWNPRRWAAWMLPSLLSRINDLLLKPSDLDAMFEGASVTRLDVAVDLTVRWDRYHWSRAKPTLRRLYGDEQTGQAQTAYLGSGKAKNAHGAVKLYAANLLHGDLPPGDVSRAECTVRSGATRILVSDLHALVNPFLAVRCLDVVNAAKAAKLSPMLAECFLDKCILRGLAHGREWLHGHSPVMASNVAVTVKSATPAFWQPPLFWQHWPAALHHALPWVFDPPASTAPLLQAA